MQFFYGIGTSTEIAYYSYIYAKVDADKYQKVTSFTRVATLSSIFLSSVTGQVIMIVFFQNLIFWGYEHRIGTLHPFFI